MSNVRAQLDKRRADVSKMFNETADRYDLMNDVLSLGVVHSWRKDVVAAIDPKPGEVILDLAAGTGTSSQPLVEAGANVYSTDLSLEMLATGMKRHPDFQFVNADALALPYADNVFDVVSASFGLRNMEDTLAALRELARVTKPGGRIVICEFSTPTTAWFNRLYRHYLLQALPKLAVFSSNRSAYQYLAESIIDWPSQTKLASLFDAAGWVEVSYRNLSHGIVCLHRGRKPDVGR